MIWKIKTNENDILLLFVVPTIDNAKFIYSGFIFVKHIEVGALKRAVKNLGCMLGLPNPFELMGIYWSCSYSRCFC
jgi:hypothetical protein